MNDVGVDFNNLLGELSDEQFWEWASSWYDEQVILDATKDWDNDIMKEEIENIKNILHKKDGKLDEVV